MDNKQREIDDEVKIENELRKRSSCKSTLNSSTTNGVVDDNNNENVVELKKEVNHVGLNRDGESAARVWIGRSI